MDIRDIMKIMDIMDIMEIMDIMDIMIITAWMAMADAVLTLVCNFSMFYLIYLNISLRKMCTTYCWPNKTITFIKSGTQRRVEAMGVLCSGSSIAEQLGSGQETGVEPSSQDG